MIDPVQMREGGQVAAVPRPPGVRPGLLPSSGDRPVQAEPGVREALDRALRATMLGGRDRQFLSRLVHRDKCNAAAVASLLWRARPAGRAEVALAARQMEIVLTALGGCRRLPHLRRRSPRYPLTDRLQLTTCS